MVLGVATSIRKLKSFLLLISEIWIGHVNVFLKVGINSFNHVEKAKSQVSIGM